MATLEMPARTLKIIISLSCSRLEEASAMLRASLLLGVQQVCGLVYPAQQVGQYYPATRRKRKGLCVTVWCPSDCFMTVLCGQHDGQTTCLPAASLCFWQLVHLRLAHLGGTQMWYVAVKRGICLTE